MSTTATTTAAGVSTGFSRVTIVAPDSRIDVALPDDIPAADIYPEILRLSGQTPAEGAPVGYHLVRRDGSVLDGARSFSAQRILDGEVLILRPFGESLPPAVFDEVSDAVATAVTRDRTLWSDDLLRIAGLTGGGVLLSLMAFVLWSADPVRHDTHGLTGILAAIAGVLLAALSAVRVRVYDDAASSIALGLGALPNVFVAGTGLLPLADGHGAGRLQFLLGCVAVLVAAAVLIAASPGGGGPFVAGAFAATVGTLAAFVAVLTDLRPVDVAAICVPCVIGVIAFLPGLSARFARLPIGYEPPRSGGYDDLDVSDGPGPVDAEHIAAQARRGHDMLVGLVGGCAVVLTVAAAVLGFSASAWGQGLALAAGLAILLRARLFRYTSQVTCALTAGLAVLVLLAVGLALNSPVPLPDARTAFDIRIIWLTVAMAVLAAVAVAIGLVVPRKGLTPFWGRMAELFENLVLLSLLPLCLAVLDVYGTVRSMTSG